MIKTEVELENGAKNLGHDPWSQQSSTSTYYMPDIYIP